MKPNAITVGDLALQRRVLDLNESLNVWYDMCPARGSGDEASVTVTRVDGSEPAPLQDRWARALVEVCRISDELHLRLRRN